MTDWSQFQPVEPASAGKVDWSKFTPVGKSPTTDVMPWQQSTGVDSGEHLATALDIAKTPANFALWLPNEIASGLGAIGSTLTDGLDAGADTAREWSKPIFEPNTEAGKTAADVVGYPFEKFGDLAQFSGEQAIVHKAALPPPLSFLPDPVLGAGAETAVQALPFAFGGHKAGDLARPAEHGTPMAPTAADLTATESASAAAAPPTPSTSILGDLVKSVGQELSQPASTPLPPSAPAGIPGRAASPVPPPPPEIAAMLDKLPPEHAATPLGQLIAKLREPGAMELPQKPGQLPEVANDRPTEAGPVAAVGSVQPDRIVADTPAPAETPAAPVAVAARPPAPPAVDAGVPAAAQPQVPVADVTSLTTPTAEIGKDSASNSFDQQRYQDLRARRDTLTPDEQAEYTRHVEQRSETAEVGGEHIPGVLNSVGRSQLEASGGMKPARVKTDLDDFKDINDTLGHDVGDEALRMKAQAMLDAFGPGNSWREGGDEFGAHADTPEAAHAAMAKVREALSGAKLEATDHAGNVVASKPLKISYGVGEGENPKVAAKAADNALYTDKAARTASGERTGRRATDAPGSDVSQGMGSAREVPGRDQVPPDEAGQVAVADEQLSNGDRGSTESRVRLGTDAVDQEGRGRVSGDDAGAANAPAESFSRGDTKPAAVPEGQTEVTARNAAIDADRLARDLPEIPEAERQEWSTPHGEALSKIEADANWPKRLAAEVASKPRPLTATETMGLTHDLRSLTAEHSAATKEVLTAREAGDTIGEAQAVMRQREAEAALTKNHEAIRVGGTEAARALSIRNAIVKDDYSIGRNMDRAKAAYGDKLDGETKAALEHLSAKIKEKDERIATLEKQREAKSRAGQPKTADERMQEKIQKQMDELNAKVQARLTACPI